MKNIKDVEKEILKNESVEIAKVVKPVENLLKDEEKVKKIVQSVFKNLSKDGIYASEGEISDFVKDLWNIYKYDVEYVPGYADEFVANVKETFYLNDKLSKKKIVQFAVNKYLDC